MHAFIEGSEQIDSKGSLYERGEIVTQSKHPSTYLYFLFEFFTLKHGCLQRLLTPFVCGICSFLLLTQDHEIHEDWGAAEKCEDGEKEQCEI